MINKNVSASAGLNIIVVGGGKVGATLVEMLSKEGNDITIIDSDPNIVSELTGQYDVMGLTGNGASYSTLIEAGIENADLIIAVTPSDELNLLCCIVAKQVVDCDAIARVRNPEYSQEAAYLRDKLGLTMIINPELEAAKEAARILCLPTALEVTAFAHGQAELIRFEIGEGNILDGMTLAEFGKMRDSQVIICAVERDGQVYIPSGDFQIIKDDIVSFVAPRNKVKAFLKNLGLNTKQVKDTMIVGGGKSTFYLAKQLVSMGIDVKIIENNRERCEELGLLLPEATIIYGDGTDQDLLEEEGIRQASSFISLTGIDEENILLTLHARNISDAKVITKITRINYKEVLNSLDLGSVIYPRYITCEAIIAYARAKKNTINSNIETLYHMYDSQAEAIEFSVKHESEVTDTPIMDLNLKKNLLITFINRNGNIIIPTGQDCIQVGDSVMIVTTHSGFDDILDILE